MNKKKVSLPDLNYAYNGLESVISEKIMRLHHDVHHKGYVDKANLFFDKLTDFKKGSEVDIKSILKNLSFNYNGAKLHEIFWQNMTDKYEKMTKNMEKWIENNFESVEKFVEMFSKTASSVEGSGWAVLGVDNAKNGYIYQVEKHNQGHLSGLRPVLVLDVWEHAYYIDYENRRDEYIEKWWKVVNWKWIEKKL